MTPRNSPSSGKRSTPAAETIQFFWEFIFLNTKREMRDNLIDKNGRIDGSECLKHDRGRIFPGGFLPCPFINKSTARIENTTLASKIK